MKNEDIYDGITDIRDDILDRTEKTGLKQGKKPRRRRWIAAVAAVLAVAFVGGALHLNGGGSGAAYAVAEPDYPEMAAYPNEDAYWKSNGEFDSEAFSVAYDAWWEGIRARRSGGDYAAGLEGFFTAGVQQILSDPAGTGGNRVCSPLNIYMALGMLAELTDGESRQQILDLLGSDSVEALRAQANALWNANYRKDGAVSSVLAASVWLDRDVEYVQETLETLAESYYAASYQGEMGSEELDRMLQDWLNTQTGGLLQEQAAGIRLDADTIMALATTIYFQAKWSEEFSPANTKPGTFHAADGDMSCDFMHQSRAKGYYWGDRFGAVGQRLENGGSMWFLLPDEGVSVDELLADPQAMEFILADGDWEDHKHLIVNQAIPKFDVCSQLDLRSGLRELGICDVFDAGASDFSPMTTDTEGIFLSRVQHDARVMIDEEGCTAVAYTVMAMAGAAAPPEEEMDFIVDRPFLFAITGDDGLPLFVGVVTRPV